MILISLLFPRQPGGAEYLLTSQGFFGAGVVRESFIELSFPLCFVSAVGGGKAEWSGATQHHEI